MTAIAVGIDVGGTKIAGALIAADGAVIHEIKTATPRSERGADPAGTATMAMVNELLAHRDIARHDLVGVGIGVPEYVDPHGRITSSLVLAWDTEPAAWFAARNVGTVASTGPPDVMVESDVRCAALAEACLGHGRGVSSCLYVTVGTGISHTMLIDGEVWSGHRGEAIAIGELPASTDARLVRHASLTVEAQSSGLALERFAADLGVSPNEFDDSRLEAAYRQAGRTIASALASAVALLDPEIIVLGGGLGTSSGAFAEAIDDQYRMLTSMRAHAPPLIRSALGTRAGVIGAGLVVHQRAERAT